jgi:hypothetical protein
VVGAAARRIARGEEKQRPVLSSWEAVLEYCRTAMAFADKEQFRILFLDKRNQLIADEVQQTGTVDPAPVYPREIVKRSLELSATAVILVHAALDNFQQSSSCIRENHACRLSYVTTGSFAAAVCISGAAIARSARVSLSCAIHVLPCR